ncbi:hypothetical protein BDZ45DRAFT_803987 [Acephala macrosclerotiorum]|nr:hypothetical protein BDZ45DRAFT_803987 [Acephala macrosclerotiorum]
MAITMSFTHFPKLPLELRKMIWEHTLQPRFVYLKVRSNSNITWFSGGLNYDDEGAIPSALQINRESRYSFIDRYPTPFEGKYNTQPLTGTYGIYKHILVFNNFWHHWKRDVLSFGNPSLAILSLCVSKEYLAVIRRIVLSRNAWYSVHMAKSYEAFSRMGRLEAIYVIARGVVPDEIRDPYLSSTRNKKLTTGKIIDFKKCLEMESQDWLWKDSFSNRKAPTLWNIAEEKLEELLDSQPAIY